MPNRYNDSNLVVHPGNASEPGVIVEVRPEQAGWDSLHFQARRLAAGEGWSFATGENELALVVLGGVMDVETDRGTWKGIGERAGVFSGLPHALYLPRRTALSVTAVTGCEFAAAWVAVTQDTNPRRVTPADIWVEIRGGDHATRQINSILPPGSAPARLVVVEVYTPGGNWSSYPPHKHDIQKQAADGHILEADLDEIYYYRMQKPEGFAIQRIYTDPESPLQRAGSPIDAAVTVRDNDVVLVPEGYHPVTCPPGYNAYYLNLLAGSAQSLANSDDPQFAWVKDSYEGRDPRVPVYDISRAAGVR